MAYSIPRTLANRAGVTYDNTKTTVVFAEDMTVLKDNDAYLKSAVEAISAPYIFSADYWSFLLNGDYTNATNSWTQVIYGYEPLVTLTTKANGSVLINIGALMKVTGYTGYLGVGVDGANPTVNCIATDQLNFTFMNGWFKITGLSAGSHTFKMYGMMTNSGTITIKAWNTLFISVQEI